MAIWGEASYKVKRAITFRERFTVAELVDATDLAYSQVEQVVQRLMQQEYVRPLEADELKPGERPATGRVGRPRTRYTLVEERAKRGEFYGEVEGIASAERMSRAKERQPSTPFFQRAVELIEAMERGATPVSESSCNQAAALLADGRELEGLILEGIEIVQAHHDLAQARLEALREEYTRSEELLGQARAAFDAAGMDAPAQKVLDLTLALTASQKLVEIKRLIEGHGDVRPALERLRRFVADFPSAGCQLHPFLLAAQVVDAACQEAIQESPAATWANTRALQENTEAIRRMSQSLQGRDDASTRTDISLREAIPMLGPFATAADEPPQGGMEIEVTRKEERIRIAGSFDELLRTFMRLKP